ncbi:hypothetical protein MP638_005628 [Amoeboaphelidium occidentale]|nr:hypothetical protein MP638_005628 [Amoeboaphelidium occidentale]
MEQFNTEEEELAPKENLPMVFPFEYKHYYVRKCYKSLYKLIIDALSADSLPKTYITVTGTPGVGKSVFYNYVFRRLREADPEKVIIVATFDKRQLQEAYIFSKEENGRRLDEAEFDLSATKYPSSVHLYDAAPKVKISELQGSKMITFTSPNASWKNSMRKVGNHKTQHPMKTKGLLEILNVLGKLEEFKNDLISLRIVFVVPSRIEASYTLQQILTEARVPSREELKDTFTIKGVGEKRKSTLEKKGITGDKTLYDAVKKRQTENYSCIKVAAEKFVADVDKQELSFELETKLKNTQQFVLGLDLDYEKNKWKSDGFLETQSALDVWNNVQKAVNDDLHPGLYLDGPVGIGKSSIMYYDVHNARQLKWFVIYIPRCGSWILDSLILKTGWFEYFFDAVLAGLEFVNPQIRKKYEYCFPPENYSTWFDADIDQKVTLKFLEGLLDRLCCDLLEENDVEVLVAIDDSQELFESHENLLNTPPFTMINRLENLKKGCVFVTGISETQYRCNLGGGYEQNKLIIGCLSDDEVKTWFEMPQFANIAKHPEFNEDIIPEIRFITGDSPRELVMLNDRFGQCNDSTLNEIFRTFSSDRMHFYELWFNRLTKGYPDMPQVYRSLIKFFTEVYITKDDIYLKLFETGLVCINEGRVTPLNSNVSKVFFKILNLSERAELDLAVQEELKQLETGDKSKNWGGINQHRKISFE